MGKKRGGKGKGSGIVHKEAFQRMNYLYQVCKHIGWGLIRMCFILLYRLHILCSQDLPVSPN